MNGERTTVLAINNLSKTYPGVAALSGATVHFRSGEIHGLVGENGAGKSTLIKILAGVVKADCGDLLIAGERVEIHSGRDARKYGLSFIHQELNLIEYLNAEENIFLGRPYPKTAWGTISWRTLRKQARSILERLGMDVPLGVPVSKLSTVNRSIVAIARAFAESACIYFMDEPTTALTAAEKHRLFDLIRNLRSLGSTVVYVSHHLEEIFLLCDRITVMRDGRVLGTWNVHDLDKERLIGLMTGKELTSLFPQRTAPVGEECILMVESLCSRKLKAISFSLAKGEILGIAGLMGSGRTELLRAVYGADEVLEGNIRIGGKDFSPRSPKRSARFGVAYVPEERRSQGLILNRSIYENITLCHIGLLSRGPFLNHAKNRREAEKVGAAVKLKSADYRNAVKTLSGGNQQKVVFAKCILRRPHVLMLDEPTKGVDVGARYEIYSVIRDIADKGTGILLVSSDFSELLGLSDRLLILKEGGMLAIVENNGITEEALLNLCYGKGG